MHHLAVAGLGVPAESRAQELDRGALVALYNATGGTSWTRNTNWLSSVPVGEWLGVTTDADGRVTQLLLNYNQLTGSIPAALGSLTNLEVLYLDTNQLTGSIPPSLGSLSNLEELELHNNRLTGEIPAALAQFESTINPQQGGVNLPVGSTSPKPVEPKPPDEVQASVDAAVVAGGGLRAGGPPVTIDMSTLFSLGDGGSADTTFTARSSQPALVTAETTDDGQLVLTPQPAVATANLVGAAADGDPEPVTITVTATRADDTAEVEFTVDVESEPEPVPALPLLGQLLLALGLLAGGVRQARHWAR